MHCLLYMWCIKVDQSKWWYPIYFTDIVHLFIYMNHTFCVWIHCWLYIKNIPNILGGHLFMYRPCSSPCTILIWIMILICVAFHVRIIFIFFHMINIQYTYDSHVIGNTYEDITYVGGASELIKIPQTFLQKHTHSVLNILELFLQLSFKGLNFSSPELFWLPVVHGLLTFHIFIFLSRVRGPISTKLGTKHPWLKGIQVCPNEGSQNLFQGETIMK